jgi:hypothetical protein
MADTLMDRPGSPASGSTSSSSPTSRGGDDRPGELGNRARETLDEARQQAAGLASRVKDDGKAALSQQKEGAAEQVTGVADALRTTADELNRRNPQMGRFVSYAAERLEGFGTQLRNRDLDSLIDDATRWGRESPTALFAGSMAIGFLLSRFLKSSASTPRHSTSEAMGSASSRRGRRNTGAQDWSWSGGSNVGGNSAGSSAGSGMGSTGSGSSGVASTGMGSSSAGTTDALGGTTRGTNPGRAS